MAARNWNLVTIIATVGLLGLLQRAATAQIADPNLWVTNGTVSATALQGSTLYIGGSFTWVGPQTGAFVAIDAGSGTPRSGWPRVNGSVNAVAADGTGGWYIGGDFTGVAGVPRLRLAHLSANGALDAWNPGADNGVNALAVSGNTVYVGGVFASIGGQPRADLAALDAVSGQATAWNPGADSGVTALAVNGNTVYAGGAFASIGGQARNKLAALDAVTGQATAWNPRADDGARALAVNGSTVYAGGSFSSIGGQARSKIAALDVRTGQATPWNPSVGGYYYDYHVTSLAVSGHVVYAGGLFGSIGGATRDCIAALDATTGQATAWNPSAYGGVYALAASGNTLYAGGFFNSMSPQSSSFIAAVDSASGHAKAWNPDANERVFSLAVSDNRVYAGGFFTQIGGQSRSAIAALDTTTAQALNWNPGANGLVQALAVSEGTVYAGGLFSAVGGQPRNAIAAVDAVTGQATAWNPNVVGDNFGYQISALAVSGNRVYAGGYFIGIGGQSRRNLAALDASTGAATSWNPAPDAQVTAVSAIGDTVYAGGSFTQIAGRRVGCLARLLPAPTAPPVVTTLSPNGGEVVIVGSVRRVTWDAAAEYPGIQSVDLYVSRTGPSGPWELVAAGAPNSDNYDWKVTGGSGFGNCYLRVDARDWAGTTSTDVSNAAFSIVDLSGAPGPEAVTAFALESPAPNPVRSETAAITYAVPRRSHVRLALLDVQGREVTVLATGEQEPGRHVARLNADRLRPGMYFLRLQAPAVELTRRVVVIQ